MACDSQASDDCTRSSVVKTWTIKGTIVGVAGDYALAHAFVHWMKKGSEGKPPPLEDVSVLWLKPDGLWLFDSSASPYKLRDKFAAIGSGAQAALGAMHAGTTPRQAVAIAKRIDPNTGGRVYVKKLAQPTE